MLNSYMYSYLKILGTLNVMNTKVCRFNKWKSPSGVTIDNLHCMRLFGEIARKKKT